MKSWNGKDNLQIEKENTGVWQSTDIWLVNDLLRVYRISPHFLNPNHGWIQRFLSVCVGGGGLKFFLKNFSEGRPDLPREAIGHQNFLRKPIATCDLPGWARTA